MYVAIFIEPSWPPSRILLLSLPVPFFSFCFPLARSIHFPFPLNFNKLQGISGCYDDHQLRREDEVSSSSRMGLATDTLASVASDLVASFRPSLVPSFTFTLSSASLYGRFALLRYICPIKDGGSFRYRLSFVYWLSPLFGACNKAAVFLLLSRLYLIGVTIALSMLGTNISESSFRTDHFQRSLMRLCYIFVTFGAPWKLDTLDIF